MSGIYALVINGSIQRVSDEPHWGNLDDSARDFWLEVVDVPPTLQPWQRATRNHEAAWEVTNGEVHVTYTIEDKTPQELIPQLYHNVKQFIETQPDGWIRYDTDLKLNIIAALMMDQTNVDCWMFSSWIDAVQTEFFTLKTQLENGTIDIDISIEHFEGMYGKDGNVMPDPAISTSKLKGLDKKK